MKDDAARCEGGKGELSVHTLSLPGDLHGEGLAVSAAGQGKQTDHWCVYHSMSVF